MAKCECCGDRFNREKVADLFDEEYGTGSYEYLYSSNNFCLSCAIDLYEEDEEDDDEPPRGCRECGGPWPDCQSACPLYDD